MAGSGGVRPGDVGIEWICGTAFAACRYSVDSIWPWPYDFGGMDIIPGRLRNRSRCHLDRGNSILFHRAGLRGSGNNPIYFLDYSLVLQRPTGSKKQSHPVQVKWS